MTSEEAAERATLEADRDKWRTEAEKWNRHWHEQRVKTGVAWWQGHRTPGGTPCGVDFLRKLAATSDGSLRNALAVLDALPTPTQKGGVTR